MRISRIDHSFEECERYLAQERAGTEIIEVLLAHSLLIMISAEFEKKVKEIVTNRSRVISNDAMCEFVQKCLDSVFRSPALDEVTALLGKFGVSYKKSFRDLLDERVRLAYRSILENRNSVAHGEASTVTIGDVRKFYEEAHVVLDHFQDVLFADNGNGPNIR